MAAFSAANRDAAGKPRCFNFWRQAPAVTPSVVLLTRERRIELCAIALRVSTLRSTRATSRQALVRFTREESSPSDPVRHRDVQAAPKMCRQSIPPCRMCMPHLSTCELHTEVGSILVHQRMFTPHLSTCELHPGCVCVCRIVAGGIP
jgi:hypothetical protein